MTEEIKKSKEEKLLKSFKNLFVLPGNITFEELAVFKENINIEAVDLKMLVTGKVLAKVSPNDCVTISCSEVAERMFKRLEWLGISLNKRYLRVIKIDDPSNPRDFLVKIIHRRHMEAFGIIKEEKGVSKISHPNFIFKEFISNSTYGFEKIPFDFEEAFRAIKDLLFGYGIYLNDEEKIMVCNLIALRLKKHNEEVQANEGNKVKLFPIKN